MSNDLRDIDVLIIDDEAPVAKALRRMLQLEGFNVEIAVSAEEGLEKIRESDCSLLICDQHMPDMSGTQLIEKAHQNGWKGKEILLTGLERTPEVEFAEKAGLRVFHKPWNTDELKKMVRESVGINKVES